MHLLALTIVYMGLGGLSSAGFSALAVEVTGQAVVMATTVAAAEPEHEASIIIYGRAWTADTRRPFAEAIAIAGDKIVTVGSRDDVDKFRGAKTKTLDAAGGLVVPG